MKMLRRFNRNGMWKQTFISDKIINKIRDDLREENKKLMVLCIQDAKEIMGQENAESNGETMQCMTAISLALFDKVADPIFTRLQARLDEIELAERGDDGLVTPETKEETEELRQEKIKTDTENDDVPTKELMEVEDGL